MYDLFTHCFEPFSKDARNIGLGDECIAIDALHEAENGGGFVAASHDENYFLGLFGIPPHSIDDGATSAQLGVDMGGNFVVML